MFTGTRVPVQTLLDYLETRPWPRSSRQKNCCSPVCVLRDECLPRRLKDDLPGHDVKTVPEVGWAGRKNGELALRARSNRLEDRRPLMPRVREVLARLPSPGSFTRVSD